MNYMQITKNDIANGSGVRVSLWVSGCHLRCPGCHNPESWDHCAGKQFTDTTFDFLIDALEPSYIQGLTITGGHPLDPENVDTVYSIVKSVRQMLPKKDIWLYTGYTLSDCDFEPEYDYDPNTQLPINQVIQLCDVVVDGRYMEDLRDVTLKFRGSSNQRLIDVEKTKKQGKIILLEEKNAN